MSEQARPEFRSRPPNLPVQPGPAQPDPAQEAKPDPAGAAGMPSGQAAPEGGTADDQPRPAGPLPTEAAARPADSRKSSWTGTPAGGFKAGTAGDDIGQIRRDNHYLEALVASVPRATGEDGRADLAVAHEIHAAVEPKGIFDRWRVEDLFHGTVEVTRYRTQRVALANASRFKALVFLLLPFTNDLGSLATEIAMKYFGSEGPEARKQATSIVRGYNITDAAISAHAAELHPRSIPALDRLVAQGQTRRSSIVREVERDKRRAAKAKAKKSKPDQPDQPELALN
jgi:hypothetical protein